MPGTGATTVNKIHNSEHDPCRNVAGLALLSDRAGRVHSPKMASFQRNVQVVVWQDRC